MSSHPGVAPRPCRGLRRCSARRHLTRAIEFEAYATAVATAGGDDSAAATSIVTGSAVRLEEYAVGIVPLRLDLSAEIEIDLPSGSANAPVSALALDPAAAVANCAIIVVANVVKGMRITLRGVRESHRIIALLHHDEFLPSLLPIVVFETIAAYRIKCR